MTSDVSDTMLNTKRQTVRTDQSPTMGFTHAVESDAPRKGHLNWKAIVATTVVVAGLTSLVVWFLRWDRSNTLSRIIQSTGPLGIGLSILFMATFSLLPVPSEFLMIVIMKIYGPWWGVLYSWIGSMSSAMITFFLARHFGKQLMRAFISEKNIRKVSRWIANRGAFGLILSRIIPVPFIVVNYTAGISPGVTWWNYAWTSAVGGIPYYVGSALVFLGASHKYMTWIFVGGIAVLGIWVGGYLYNRRLEKERRLSA